LYRELRKLDLSSPVTSLSLCGDGKTLAIGTNAGEVMIYDLRSSIRPLFSSKAHDSASINFLQFATVAGTDPLHAGGLYSSNKSVSSCSSTSSTGSSAGSTSSSSTKSYSLQNGEPVQELTLRKLNPLSTLAQLASSDMITTSKCTSDTMSNSSSKTNFQIGASTGTKSNFTKLPCATTSSLDNKTTSSPAPSLSSSTAITSNKQIERHLGSPLSGPVEETNHFDQVRLPQLLHSSMMNFIILCRIHMESLWIQRRIQ
jgi:hypothetical protein